MQSSGGVFEGTFTRTNDLSPPGTSETKDRVGSSLEYHSSQGSIGTDKRDGAKGDAGGKGKSGSPAGRMLDSDGFEMADMEAEDFEHLTLEEKILCGFYTAKPFTKGAYPIAQLNMPKFVKP